MTIEFKAPEIGPNADALTSLTRGRGPRRGNLEDLLKYWRPIMKKPGGFRRCVVILMDKPQFGGKPQRICAWLHHELTGKWPNEGNHHGRGGKKRKKRRGRSVTRRVRSAGKKSLMGTSPLTEVTSLRMAIRESREFGGILVQPIAGRQNVVDMKVAMFLQHSEPLSLFAGNEVKRVGAFGSSSRLGQAAQAAGSIILPGDLSDVRSPIRSQIYETLTPGVPGGRRGRGGRLLRGTGRGARNKFRCPPGFEKGGTFTNSEFSTCGAQILGIATRGPGAPTDEANRRLSRLANTAGLVNEIGDLRKNTNAVDIIRAAQIPAAPKKGSPTRAQTSIDLVLARYAEEDFPTKIVRRDGVILEPVVSVEALGRLNEFDDMADGSLIEKYEAGQIGASTVPAFSAGLRNVFVSIPDAGAVQISRVGGEISDQERAGLLRSFATGISRSADLPDPSAAVRAWADGSDGRFTVDFGKVTDNGFEVADGDNELIKVATAGGKTETVPRWVYETFLSRSAPRRAKDAPIYEIVAEEGAGEKSVSPFTFSQKSVTSINDFSNILDAKDYHLSINSKVKAFTYLTDIDVKAPRGRGLGRRIGRGGRAVGGRSRAVFDGASGRYRCPPGTRYGGRFSDQFGRNCGYSLPRGIVNRFVDFGMRVEDAMERRRRRRVDARPGDGGTNLKPESVEKLDDAIGRLDSATDALGKVFEKTEGAQGGTLGRTIGEARRDVDLTPEERELLEGNELAAALENLRDVLNDQDLNNANLDEIRKAYKSVERAANVEAGRMTDNPPRTPEQRSRRDGILAFLEELILRLLGIWNEDDERARAMGGRGGVDTRPGDGRGPSGPGGRRPRADSDDGILIDGDGPRPRIPRDGDDGDGILIDGDGPRPRLPEPRSEDDLADILEEFRERAEEYEVAGGGMTQDFVESLDDNDLDRFINAFEEAADLLADDPRFDDINDALIRLRGERDRRDRQRSLVNADLRQRFDIDTEDGLADAIEHFEDLADEYEASGILTQDFFERLNDDEIAFFQDVFDRAVDAIGDNDDGAFDAIARRLEEERARRDALNREEFSKEDYNLVLKEMNAHMKRFEVAGGGMTADFFDALSDDDLIKYRRAVRDGLDADAFDGENREALQELLQRMDGEFDRRFKGPGKRPRIESEENSIEDKFNLEGDTDLEAALREWEKRAADFEVAGGGMTQDLVEALSNEELIFFEDAHLRLRDRLRDANSFDSEPLDEIINRLRAERERRGFNRWGEGSEPDERSLRNVNNRFPRNGLPDRAYWRDSDYDGDDASELDRRFGRYYDGENLLNDRGREVNRRLRGSDTDPNAPGGAPNVPSSPDDPDNLSRFTDDELMDMLAAIDDLPFNIERISDDDLRRLDELVDRRLPNFAGLDDREQERRFPNALNIVQEYNRLQDNMRNSNRLGVTSATSAVSDQPNVPTPIPDGAFSVGRKTPAGIVDQIIDASPDQIQNLRGAMLRDFAELNDFWVKELGGRRLNIANISDLINAEADPDRRRLLNARFNDFRELNEAARRFNANDADDFDVIADHLARVSLSRREGILGLIDNGDAIVERDIPRPETPRVVLNTNERNFEYADAVRQFARNRDQYIDGLSATEVNQLLDIIDTREADGNLIDPNLRDRLRNRHADLLDANDGTMEQLVERIAGMSDESLAEMNPRDARRRESRLGAGVNGNPPSRQAVAQAERLRVARENRERENSRIPDGPVDVPAEGGVRDRVAAVLGDDVLDPDDDKANGFLRSLTDEEFKRLLVRQAEMMPAFSGIDDEEYLYLQSIRGRIIRERDRRTHVNRFQLDVPINERTDEKLDKYERYLQPIVDRVLEQVDGQNSPVVRELEAIKREKRIRLLAQSPSVLDSEDFTSDRALLVLGIPEQPGPEDVESLEKFLSNTMLHDMLSTSAMLKFKERIQNSPNLSESDAAGLLRQWDSIMRNRPVGFERNLDVQDRSAEALQRHIDFLKERVQRGVNDAQRGAYEDFIGLLDKQRIIRIAADGLSSAVDSNPSLSGRWRDVAKWNFLKARRLRQQKREQKIQEIFQRRYPRSRMWQIGGHDGLSGMSDAQVKNRIKATFLGGQDIDVGTVEINGETYRKTITPTNIRTTISRRPDGKIKSIEVNGHLKFSIIDSNGNVVASETHRQGQGYAMGWVHRTFTWDENGVGMVAHQHLGTDRTIRFNGQNVKFKGGGFTDEMFNNNLLFYRNMGVEKVEVSAAQDGAVVWPRIGFRNRYPSSIKKLNSTMEQVLDDYRGYKRAKETGVTVTPQQLAAKALIQDDVRFNRLDVMLEPHRANPDDADAMPGIHDFMLALEGENYRNSIAFQLFRGGNELRVARNVQGREGVVGLDDAMLDQLFADEPDLEDELITNPFAQQGFGSGIWDISDILADAGGDPRRVRSNLVDPYDRPVDLSPRASVGALRQRMNPNASPTDQRPVEGVPVGTNNINSVDDAAAWLVSGEDVAGVPDEFVNKAILALSDIMPQNERLGDVRFVRRAGGDGINQGASRFNGAQVMEDTVTGQMFVIKYNGGIGYGYDEAAGEAVGRAVMIRLGFNQGQIRFDGPPDSNTSKPARGYVGEALHNYAPDGVEARDITTGSMEASGYTNANLDDLTHMFLGDALIVNTDRHRANFLQYRDPDTGELRMVPIDMGLGMRGRDRNGDYLGVQGMSPEDQLQAWASNGAGGRHDLNGMQKALRRLARNDASRAEMAESFDRALARLRAAHDQEGIRPILDGIALEHGGLDSDGWKRAQDMFLERYGWLIESGVTGGDLVDLFFA